MENNECKCECKNKTTVPEIIEEIKATICHKICKYYEAYDNIDLMMKERCEKCVLNLL